jgi:hypothetical protein
MTARSPTPPPPVEYDLLVEPVFKVRRHWPQPEFPIQNVPFRFGLRFTNMGEKPFPGCKFRDVRIIAEAIKRAVTFDGDYALQDSGTAMSDATTAIADHRVQSFITTSLEGRALLSRRRQVAAFHLRQFQGAS